MHVRTRSGFALKSPGNPNRPFERLEGRRLLSVSPAGAEFPVNTFTTAGQLDPSVAVDGDGDFVVVWTGAGAQDGSGLGIFAQRFDSSAAPLGPEFRVNTFTTGEQSHASVAADAQGDFVVTWASQGQDGSNFGVFARRFDAAGNPIGAEFRANTYTTGVQASPAVAMAPDGRFVIAWASLGQDGSDYGIYAKRYDAAGAVLGGEFRANSYTTQIQSAPAVAMDGAGNFTLTWNSTGQEGTPGEYGIYARRYSGAGGAPLDSAEFRVNTYTPGDQLAPSIAESLNGGFVVAWSGDKQDGSSSNIYAQRFDAAGVKAGSEFLVNTATDNVQRLASVAADAQGDFVVTWESYGADDPGSPATSGIAARRFDAAGNSQGGEFAVNTFTTGQQGTASVAIDPAGDFVIAWTSDQQDGSGNGVYAQRFHESIDNAGPMIGSVSPNGEPTALTPGARLSSAPLTSLQVRFSEAMATSGAGSVLRQGNWLLTRNGVDISATLLASSYGLNPATRRYEMRLDLSSAITGGHVTLALKQTACDASGVALDGDYNGAPGGDFSLAFDVASAAPVVEAVEFDYSTAVHRLKVHFDQDVSQSLDTSDLAVTRLSDQQNVDFGAPPAYDLSSNIATFSFGVALADSRYSAAFSASGIANPLGQTLDSATPPFDFFALTGDANHDAKVNIVDLGVLAGNWQASGRTFAQGDFNYDGAVNIVDLGILASRWQASLALPGAVSPPARPRLSGGERLVDEIGLSAAT